MKKLIGLITLVALESCSFPLAPFGRTEYIITQKNELMITNSNVYNDRAYPDKQGDRYEIKYSFFLENSSATNTTTLQFNQAYFKVLSEKTAAKCRELDKEPPLTETQLKPGQQFSVNCIIEIPDVVAKKIKGDQKGFFEIPFSDKNEKNMISFLYIVKQEDFQ